ncbi:hypothetical protein ACIHCQ_29705 [Streptomyces sp. NPDC052236]|uniref:hypothetical protein n=1 Tax=Streptomyces sp. NPDC052236 TaxID=3365686 RepID=UPI0037D5AF11
MNKANRRLFKLYADPAADEDSWTEIPRDATAARALLGTIGSFMGYEDFSRVTRSALAAHHRYMSDAAGGLTYALCRDTALREKFENPDDVPYMDWAALLLETVRIQMGDAAFSAFLQCVVATNDTDARWEGPEDSSAAASAA